MLHVLGSLGLGGIETWLMQMLRHADRFAVGHELLLTQPQVGAYEAEARELGIPIHRISLRDGRWAWFPRFHRFLAAEGPFAIVHAHEDIAFAAPLLAVARLAGVPVRIAHSHSARSLGGDYPSARRLARWAALPILPHVATRRIGISEAAIREIAGRRWRARGHATVLHYGFDFARFAGAHARARVLRERLGLPDDAPVVGNVARFRPVKNHKLLVQAFALCRERLPGARLVLVGAGPLRAEIEAQIDALGLRDAVHFAGTTDDVPAFMALFDVFALPSFSEGLGIVCVEAQAAGTPTLVSQAVPPEVSVVPGGVEVVDLDGGVPAWAGAIERVLRRRERPDADEWLLSVKASRFDLGRCIRALDAVYRCELERHAPPS